MDRFLYSGSVVEMFRQDLHSLDPGAKRLSKSFGPGSAITGFGVVWNDLRHHLQASLPAAEFLDDMSPGAGADRSQEAIVRQ